MPAARRWRPWSALRSRATMTDADLAAYRAQQERRARKQADAEAAHAAALVRCGPAIRKRAATMPAPVRRIVAVWTAPPTPRAPVVVLPTGREHRAARAGHRRRR